MTTRAQRVLVSFFVRRFISKKIELQYAGIKERWNSDEDFIGTKQENIDKDGVTHVTLDNTSPNAKIDYATGDDAGRYLRRRRSRNNRSYDRNITETTVNPRKNSAQFVALKRKSDVYWYNKANMPHNTEQGML